MSPNALLVLEFKPEANARDVLEKVLGTKDEVQIGAGAYRVVDGDCAEDSVYAPEGSLVFFHLATYGYGDRISWKRFQQRKEALEKYGERLVKKYGGKFSIYVSANYW